jgi:hypothetical protein
MRSARKARLSARQRLSTGQPAPARRPARAGLRPAWYLPELPGVARSLLDGEDLQDLIEGVFGPGSTRDERTAAVAMRLAVAALNHVTTTISTGQARLSPVQLTDLLTGLNLSQAHIVQCAEHVADQVRHRLHPGSTGIPEPTNELLADALGQVADRGQLAAAHLHEARLIIDAS